MKCAISVTVCAGAALALAVPASADWVPGDGHKMHFPQMPDLDGWDVCATDAGVIADDWQCSETGPVTDIHFWGSWFAEMPSVFENIHLSIHENIPAGVGGPNFSQPGALLWEQDFGAGQYTMVDPWDFGDQGWYSPKDGEIRMSDHTSLHLVNIVDIPNPFIQQSGEIYWLDISVTLRDLTTRWGWKTSQDHFMDNATWLSPGTQVWNEMYDPIEMTPLDMAFVITPSPAGVALLALAGLVGLSARRRR